jgi:alkylation response protein AidB-like acyl-CoA dehydrogenase
VLDFAPDEEQELVVETVRAFAAEELRPRAREADEARKLPAEVLERAHALGLVTNALPEAYGGSGQRSAVTAALVAEELGWGDLSLAIAILSPGLLALPLAEFGTPEQQAEWLPALAGTSFVPSALAWVEPRFDSDVYRPQTRAQRSRSDWRIDGAKCLVPWIDGQRAVGVVASDGTAPQLFLVPVDAAGLRATPATYMGLRALALVELELQGVRVPERARLGGADLRRIVSQGRVALAALAVGVARAAYELARDYAKQRETFGAPIATRQSIAFMLADMATEVDGLRLLTWEAAWRLDRALDASREAALALQHARRVVMQGADGAVQIFGGHGYTREYLPELLLRNAAGFASFEALALV